MKSRDLLARCNRKLFLTLAAGGIMMQINFAGCDTDLRNNLLAGIQTSIVALITTFINAFFQALMAESASSQAIVKVILDSLPALA